MNWQSHEKLVKDIYEKLGRSVGVEIICWGPSCKIKGESGAYHQIDVLTSHSDGVHTYKTAIECKNWNKKVSKDAITKLAVILEDTGVEKGVVVSSLGFTEDSKKVAEYKNISLVELRRPADKDWEGRIKDIHIGIHIDIPEIYDYEFFQDNTEDKDKLEKYGAYTDEVKLCVPNVNSITLHELTNKILGSSDADGGDAGLAGVRWTKSSIQQNGEHIYVIQFPDQTALSFFASDDKEKTAKIRGLKFKVKHIIATERIVIKGEEYIAMILHSIFDNRKFSISTDGAIRPFGRSV